MPIGIILTVVVVVGVIAIAFLRPRAAAKDAPRAPETTPAGELNAAGYHNDHAGDVTLSTTTLHWVPNDDERPEVTVDRRDVSTINVQSLPGLPRSTQLTFVRGEGDRVEFTVFAKPRQLRRILNGWAQAPR
jgi:hypothetical protein